MFSLLWQVLQQRLSNFYKQNFVWASETIFFETFTKIQKALIGAKYWWIPLKQRVLTSLACTATNSEKLSQIELRPDKWNQESRKPSPKFRKHCSEQITWWILMKRSVLALLICTATNYEQLSQTKLRLDIWNQVFTKTLTKLQKTLIGVKYLTNSNETKCFRFLEYHCNNVWAAFTNWIVSWNGRSSIHKNPHQNPENTDRSKTLGQFQPYNFFDFLNTYFNKVWAWKSCAFSKFPGSHSLLRQVWYPAVYIPLRSFSILEICLFLN